MTPKLKIFLLVTPLVILVDQFSKYLVKAHLAPYASVTLVENFVHLSHVRNPGGAFGVLSWVHPNFFVVIAGLAIGVVFVFFWSLGRDQRLSASALSLILGGAVGNLIDRVRMGSVVDFIDVHWHSLRWPAFNVADAAITVGVFLLVLELLSSETHRRQGMAGESMSAE
jgi:signal peptidase II